jgi:hypothetical protein
MCAGGLLATLLTAVPVLGDGKLADLIPPYTSANITALLNDDQVIKELKISKDQTTAIKKILEKSQKSQSGDADKIYKMPNGPDKYPKIRALTAMRAEQLFQDLGKILSAAQVKRLKQIMLQAQGITVIEHPEIRAQLKLSNADVKRLTAEYDRLKKQVQEQALRGKITMTYANERLHAMSKGIPDGVRAEMDEEQRKTLREMLGEPYAFRK